MGDTALNNADSAFNTAVGFQAGQATTTGVDNIYLGDNAGTLDLTGAPVPAGENSTIRIGSLFTNSQCFIGGIATFPQVWNGVTVCQVTVNGFGQLGVDCVNPNNPGSTPQGTSAPVPHNAMLNRKVEALEATVAELRGQLKEQAAQIQKVSAQLEVSKPAPQVVTNKP
jgi:hypothetical protein